MSNLFPFFHFNPLDFLPLPLFCLPFLPVFHSLCLKAFAWWSDLMVEHAETFLCLYSADMDAALEVQPPDSWDSFPLFQLLNDFLRMDCEWGAIKRKHIQQSVWGLKSLNVPGSWSGSVKNGSDTRVYMPD